jgi:superfamily II DNA/RNA helicase
MVFCRTKRTAQKVADELLERGFAAAAVHGDLGQGAREQALRAFRSGKVDVLVATDVAARGIDVTGVTHVINFQCPEDEKTYLHRIGRTGRAGASGVAVTFVDWDETPRWEMINKALDLPFADPPETYSTSEHLYAELDIPARATGTLPHRERTRAGLAAEEVEDLGETGRRRKGAAGPSSGPATGSGGDARGRRGRTTRRDDDERPARGGDDAQAEVAGDEPARPKRTRARRRTRSGGAVAADGGAETLVDAPADTLATGPADGPGDGSEAVRTPRKRSRRKPAADGGESAGSAQATAIAETGTDTAPSTDPATGTSAAPAQNGSAPRTRTRTRGAIPQAETSSQEPVAAVRSAGGPAPVMMFSAGDSTAGSTTSASRTAAAPVTTAPGNTAPGNTAPGISTGEAEPAAKAPRRRTRRAADAAPDAAPAE